MTTLGLLYLQVNKWYCTVYMEKLDTVIIIIIISSIIIVSLKLHCTVSCFAR